MKESNYWGTPHTNPRMPLDGMDERKKKPRPKKPKASIKSKPIKNARARKVKKETAYTAWTSEGFETSEITKWSCSYADYEKDDQALSYYSNLKIVDSGGLTQQYEAAKNKRDFTYLPGAYGIQVKGANIYGRMATVVSDLKGYMSLSPPYTIANLTLRMTFDGSNWDMNIYANSKGKIVWTAGRNGNKPRQMQWKALKAKLVDFGFSLSFAKVIIDASNSGWGQFKHNPTEAKGFIQACKNNAPPPGDLPYSAAADALDIAIGELWDSWYSFVEGVAANGYSNWETDPDSPQYLKDIEKARKEVEPKFEEVEKILGVMEEFHSKNYEVLVAENKSMPSGKPINSTLKGTGQGLLKVLEEMKTGLDTYEDAAKEQVKAFAVIFEMQTQLEKDSAILADLVGEGRYGNFRGSKGGEGFLSRGQPSYEMNRDYANYTNPYNQQLLKSLEVKDD